MHSFEEKTSNPSARSRTQDKKNDQETGVTKARKESTHEPDAKKDAHPGTTKDKAKKPSDYYSPDGTYLYSNKDYDNKVFIISEAPAFDQSLEGSGFLNKKEVTGLPADKFRIVAHIIKQEAATGKPEEFLDIANASNNEAKGRSMSIYDLLMTKYSSVKNKSELKNTDISDSAKFARAAVLSILQGYSDSSGGATFWDGTDFLAWGLQSPNGTPQNKFEEYNQIEIPKNIYDNYLDNNRKKYGDNVTYGKVAYNLPAKVFLNAKNWEDGSFVYKTGVVTKYKIVATAAAGLSIFWKKVLNVNANGKN